MTRAGARWGCFLPDLTRLASETSLANLPPAISGMSARIASRHRKVAELRRSRRQICQFGVDLVSSIRHKPATCAAERRRRPLSHDRLGWPCFPRKAAAVVLIKAPETDREENLSTQQAGSQAPPRLSRPHGDQGWPQGHRRSPRPRPQAPVGLTSPGASR